MDFQHLKSLAVALLDSLKKWLSLYSYDQLFLHLGWAVRVVKERVKLIGWFLSHDLLCACGILKSKNFHLAWTSNKTVAMSTCYRKQKLATLALPPGFSDWSTSLELTLMSGHAFKSWNSFNSTLHFKKSRDVSKVVIHVNLVCFYIETQRKSSALELKMRSVWTAP